MKRLGLRSEIVLQLGLLMAAALLLSSVLILKFYEQEMLQQQIDSAISQLRILSYKLPENLNSKLPESLRQPFSHSPLVSLILQKEDNPPHSLLDARLPTDYNADSLRKSGVTGQFLVKVDYARHFFGWEVPQTLQVSVPLRGRAPHGGALQGRFSLKNLANQIYALHDIVLLIVALFGLILTLFGSYLLGKNVVKPVLELEEASKKVSGGDLDQQLSPIGSQTLINLSSSFNAMISALREARANRENHIEELEELNRQLQQTRSDLIQAEKMSSLGHLAAGMAHEIGNPLGALIGYLEILKQSPDSDSSEMISHAIEEAGRIDHLVRDLLDYARPISGQVCAIDIRTEIESSLRILQQQGACKEGQISLNLESASLLVNIAANRMQQVMINLLKNALDAAEPETTIDVRAQQRGGYALLTVSNKGHAIPRDTLNAIFDPFFTTKDPDKGRGLGLFVCHNIITDANGKIEATSSPEGLNCFSITLPLSGDTDAQA